MNIRKQLIRETQKLDNSLHIDLFHYINNNLTIQFMENTNGIFFLLNEISDDDIQSILNKVDDIKTNYMSNCNRFNNKTVNEIITVSENDESVEKTNTSSTLNKKKAFEYDKNMVKTLENHLNGLNKKSIHMKYSIAKKKYNKQQCYIDTKKIDNTDLNELTEDIYIY